jgi:sarcosine oxidase, subunit alpha
MTGRLKLPTIGIDTEKSIRLNYNGKPFQGFSGDTIATVLYAGGVRVFGRSLKYHRPRGLYSLDGESSNTFMKVNGIPNVCAEKTLALEGMQVKAQNVKGAPEFDPMAFMDKLGWAMPAGFYYRMFHKPAAIWPTAVRFIRRAAGIGILKPETVLKGVYEEKYLNTDLCVVGGGPAGLSAALTAADAELKVVLLEARPFLGGFYAYRTAPFSGGEALLHERARELADQVEAHPHIRVFKHTPAVGLYTENRVTAFQMGKGTDSFDECYLEILAEKVIVATGCSERPSIFANNEKPGVMQPGCAQRLARTYGILPGKRAVFSVGHDLGLEAAVDLSDLGLAVLGVADARQDGQHPDLLQALEERGIPILKGWVATKAMGGKTVEAVRLQPENGAHSKTVSCDLLAASAGLTPLTGLLTLGGATLAYDDHTGFFLPRQLPEGLEAAGRLMGLNDPAAIELSGKLAAGRILWGCGKFSEDQMGDLTRRMAERPGPVRGSKFVCAPGSRNKAFLCFDEDATLKHVDQAMALGFNVPELIKRYTSAGTGPGQGGIPGHNLPLYVAGTCAAPDPRPRPTTVRPPITPTLIATYAGAGYHLNKRTPVHDLQVKAGGKMEVVGQWERARRFGDESGVSREIDAVRNNVAMLDASTLGKFRVSGPDALKVLQHVYVSDMSKLNPGRVRYSAMCNEDACVIDDGVVIKRADNDYYLTTTTGRAGVTAQWIRYHTRYENWRYGIVNLTDAFGVINLAGPRAREVLQAVTDEDVSNEAFEFGAYREFTIADAISVRAMRLGFVGEISYELHVPASYMPDLWQLMEAAGKPMGITNFGLEAQNTLRMEKGHVILGSESEQRTTLHDIGLGFLWHRDKTGPAPVGSFALRQTENQAGRLKLVGFKPLNNHDAPQDGSPIVDTRIRGYVCTARFSRSLNQPLGMALVDHELQAVGTEFDIYQDGCKGELMRARVLEMPFYDPEGLRMRM